MEIVAVKQCNILDERKFTGEGLKDWTLIKRSMNLKTLQGT